MVTYFSQAWHWIGIIIRCGGELTYQANVACCVQKQVKKDLQISDNVKLSLAKNSKFTSFIFTILTKV